jgi:DNA-binding protein H-NS
MRRSNSINDVDLEAFQSDELWALHETLARILTARIQANKQELERRLASLGQGSSATLAGKRPYPRVFPKYQNSSKPSETWSGRGKRPRWLTAALKSGRKIDDFKISKG